MTLNVTTGPLIEFILPQLLPLFELYGGHISGNMETFTMWCESCKCRQTFFCTLENIKFVRQCETSNRPHETAKTNENLSYSTFCICDNKLCCKLQYNIAPDPQIFPEGLRKSEGLQTTMTTKCNQWFILIWTTNLRYDNKNVKNHLRYF